MVVSCKGRKCRWTWGAEWPEVGDSAKLSSQLVAAGRWLLVAGQLAGLRIKGVQSQCRAATGRTRGSAEGRPAAHKNEWGGVGWTGRAEPPLPGLNRCECWHLDVGPSRTYMEKRRVPVLLHRGRACGRWQEKGWCQG